jgi:hypothetical protein
MSAMRVDPKTLPTAELRRLLEHLADRRLPTRLAKWADEIATELIRRNS